MEVLLKMADATLLKNQPEIINSLPEKVPSRGHGTPKFDLESAKAEMGEVREENERLKMMLKRVQNDYKSLQLRCFDIFKQDSSNKDDEQELVSLSLGRTRREGKKDEKRFMNTKQDDHDLKASLTLGMELGSRPNLSIEPVLGISTVQKSLGDSKENKGDHDEPWTPSKLLKMTMKNGDDEVAQHNHVKRARVCVRARCDTPTMIDGCQWRKYGQKISKGNPCPRAYYRCTVAPACPVRKQVQRCADDMSILITTYEGKHNHQLPFSATAMASTTSAAASMLLSTSSSSTCTSSNHPNFSKIPPPSTVLFNGSNFSTTAFDNLSETNNHCYIQNASSFSPLPPTVTLDLTTGPNGSTTSASTTSFDRIILDNQRVGFNLSPSVSLPSVWGNGYPTSFTTTCTPYQQSFVPPDHAASKQALTETLTKALSSDPSFRSAIAAAVSNMVGSSKKEKSS